MVMAVSMTVSMVIVRLGFLRMRVVSVRAELLLIEARLAQEGKRVEAGHVESRHDRRDRAQAPEKDRAARRAERHPEHFVLGEESREDRDSADREPPGREG